MDFETEKNVFINDQVGVGQKKRFKKLLLPNEKLVWSGKLNKISSKGEGLKRVFILTTERVINFGKKKKGLFRRMFGRTPKRIFNYTDIESITYSLNSFNFIINIENQEGHLLDSTLRDEFLGILLLVYENFSNQGIWFQFEKKSNLMNLFNNRKLSRDQLTSNMPVKMTYAEFREFQKKKKTVINMEAFKDDVEEKEDSESNYGLIKQLGKSESSKIFLCKNIKDGQFYAVKIINKLEVFRKNLIDKMLMENQIK